MIFNKFPYVNLQDVNIDWLLKEVRENTAETKSAVEEVNNAVERVGEFDGELALINGQLSILSNQLSDVHQIVRIDVDTSLHATSDGVAVTGEDVITFYNTGNLPVVTYRDEIYMAEYYDATARTIRFSKMFAPVVGNPYIKQLTFTWDSSEVAYSVEQWEESASGGGLVVTIDAITLAADVHYAQIVQAIESGVAVTFAVKSAESSWTMSAPLWYYDTAQNVIRVLAPWEWDTMESANYVQLTALVLREDDTSVVLTMGQLPTITGLAHHLANLKDQLSMTVTLTPVADNENLYTVSRSFADIRSILQAGGVLNIDFPDYNVLYSSCSVIVPVAGDIEVFIPHEHSLGHTLFSIYEDTNEEGESVTLAARNIVDDLPYGSFDIEDVEMVTTDSLRNIVFGTGRYFPATGQVLLRLDLPFTSDHLNGKAYIDSISIPNHSGGYFSPSLIESPVICSTSIVQNGSLTVFEESNIYVYARSTGDGNGVEITASVDVPDAISGTNILCIELLFCVSQ